MRVWILNFPNTAKLLKGLTFLVVVLLLVVFWALAMEIFQQRDSLISHMNYRQAKLEKYKLLKHLDLASYNHSVCLEFVGRLGNQMFQYASAYGIAKTKKMKIRINTNDPVAKIFKLSATQVKTRNHCGHAKAVFERFHCAYDSKLLTFKTNTDIKLLSYLQSWKYFMNATEDIRKEFTFRPHIMKRARSVFYNATRYTKHYGHNGTYVGLHIRRGDMVVAQKRGKKSGYNVATRGYILHAMNYFLVKYPKVTFVICSDDINWVKKEFSKYKNLLQLVFIDKNKAEVDLAVLSLCQHTIMTTGTFSWWAGWLSGGTVVYYKHYIMEGSVLRKQFSQDFSDFFYPNWIPMT